MWLARDGFGARFETGIASAWGLARIASASVLLALAVALFLAARRLMGAMAAPLPPPQLAVTSVMLLAWGLSVRAIVPSRSLNWLIAVVMALVALACSFPAERAVDWLIWLPIAGAYIGLNTARPVIPTKIMRSGVAAGESFCLQELRRTRSPEGRHTICGRLAVEFATGERTATVYVAFCPPFELLPLMEIESAGNAKIVQVLHNGAQIEVRRSGPTNCPATAMVEFFATGGQ